MSEIIFIPRPILHEALEKAWFLYRQDGDVSDPCECWAEFEDLAEALPKDARREFYAWCGVAWRTMGQK